MQKKRQHAKNVDFPQQSTALRKGTQLLEKKKDKLAQQKGSENHVILLNAWAKPLQCYKRLL